MTLIFYCTVIIRSAILSERGSLSEYWAMLKLQKIFKKDVQTCTVFIITDNDFHIIYQRSFLRRQYVARQRWFYFFPKYFVTSQFFVKFSEVVKQSSSLCTKCFSFWVVVLKESSAWFQYWIMLPKIWQLFSKTVFTNKMIQG